MMPSLGLLRCFRIWSMQHCKLTELGHVFVIPEASLIVPDFTKFLCKAVHVILYIFRRLARSLPFSFYLLESPRKDWMPINRWRKITSEYKTKIEKISWTAVHRNCKFRDSPLVCFISFPLPWNSQNRHPDQDHKKAEFLKQSNYWWRNIIGRRCWSRFALSWTGRSWTGRSCTVQSQPNHAAMKIMSSWNVRSWSILSGADQTLLLCHEFARS